MDDLLTRPVERALRYIELLAKAGATPTASEVDTFATSEGPRDAVYSNPYQASSMSAMLAIAHAFGGEKIRDAEPVSAYLVRMGWVSQNGDHVRLSLTDLGRCLLVGLSRTEDSTADRAPVVVVLEPKSPASFIAFASAASGAGAGMLVDSFFKAESVEWVVNSTTLRRVLVSSRNKAKAEIGPIATSLAYVVGAERLEVRASDSTELHDRAIVGDDGSLRLIGTSVNGVGHHLSTIMTLSAADAASIVGRLQGIWDTAVPVTPTPLMGGASA